MLNHVGTDTIKTERLVLRPYLEGDGDAMFKNWANDEEVCQYLTWAPHANIDVSRQLVSEWSKNYMSDCFYHWGITMDGELIGDIAVVRWNERHEDAELGYCLSKKYWRQGIMTEALTAVARYLFDRVCFHRVMLRHDADNPASGRVMQKAGFHYEGCMIEAEKRRQGGWADLCIYGATKESFQKPDEEAWL